MIENYITNINNYNKTQLDYETISESKSYYSIYNNQITQPFHNFWFILTNCKFKNEYNDYKILRFGLNNKSTQIQKFICFFKNLSEHINEIFSPVYPNLTIELPWKEFDNYPFILSIFASDNTLVTNTTNTTNENDSLNSISNTKAYTILFEIKNIRIMKINLDENQNHILKFNLNMIMCQQEPELDLKSCLTNYINNTNINSNSNTITNTNNSVNTNLKLPFLKQISSVNGKNTNTNFKINDINSNNVINNNSSEKSYINLNDILEKKSNLRKVILDNSLETNITNSEDNISLATNSYINQKNQLKKTITEEKSLFKTLGKSKKKKNKNKKDIELELDLD